MLYINLRVLSLWRCFSFFLEGGEQSRTQVPNVKAASMIRIYLLLLAIFFLLLLFIDWIILSSIFILLYCTEKIDFDKCNGADQPPFYAPEMNIFSCHLVIFSLSMQIHLKKIVLAQTDMIVLLAFISWITLLAVLGKP